MPTYSKSELKRMLLKMMNEGIYDRNMQANINRLLGEAYQITLGDRERQLLWEAVGEMKTAGLIARDATQGSEDFQVLTEKGKRVAASAKDPDIYSTRLEDMITDSELLDKTLDIFNQDLYEVAVFAAYKVVEERVRKKSGATAADLGVELMTLAFKVDKGKLVIPSAAVSQEQESVHLLFRGAIGFFKNPSSHRTVNYDDRKTAIQIIGTAEVLLKILDSATLRTP